MVTKFLTCNLSICCLLLICISCNTRESNSAPNSVNSSTADGAMAELDKVIELRPEIDRKKRNHLDSLLRDLEHDTTPEGRFLSNERLFDEYSAYSMDTALLMARRCMREAYAMGNDSLIAKALIMEAKGLKGMGDYSAALESLSKITGHWRDVYREEVLNRYISVYYSLTDYASSPQEAERYRKLMECYRDSVCILVGSGSDTYWLNKAESERMAGNPRSALAYIDSIAASNDNIVDPGVVAYLRAKCMEELGNIEEAKRQYAIAAAIDIRGSVRKYEALQELARILSKEGDDEHAYKYIMCAITDIQKSNARSRIQRIAGYLPIITAAYTETQSRSSHNKTLLLIVVSALSVALLFAIFYIYRKNNNLKRERAILHEKNNELETLRKRMSEVNRSLEESAKVKEKYLGYLFNLCSEYIGSFDSYRMKIAKKVKSGNIKDIDALLSYQQNSEELRSFFHKFDSIFLDIFPDFIDKFNNLLTDGHQIRPHDGELLTPELRIYALVRLGINDSTQIAAFLHYSPQTVYNYRSRIRSYSWLPKEEFPRAVRTL